MSETNDLDPTATVTGPTTTDSGAETQDTKVQEQSTQDVDTGDLMDTSLDSTPTTATAAPPPTTGALSPPPPLGVQDTYKPPITRSQSPAKRSASEMDGDDETADYPPSPMSINNEQGGISLGDLDITNSGSVPPTIQSTNPEPQSSTATKAPDSSSETGVPTISATVIETPPQETSTTATDSELPSRPISPPPTIDDQIQTVLLGFHRPLEAGEEYCVISGKWLRKLLSYDKTSEPVLSKEEAEGELGPIDNSDLVDKVAQQKMMTEGVILLDPTNAGIPADVNGTAAEGEFSPLLPGTVGEDFEVIPYDTWKFLVKVHGVSPTSPPPLKRKAVNTQADTQFASNANIQVELYPPTFTVYRLRDPSTETTHASLGVGAKPPAKILAGRSEKVQALLKKAKSLAGIDMSRKVRIWRLMSSGGVSLNDSRPPSPANGKKNGSKAMIFDMAAFLELEVGSEKELVETFKDETNNPNYNGNMSINMAGLGDGGDILLEELDSSKEWISDKASKSTKNTGGIFQTAKAKFGGLVNRRANSANSSRSSSPARAGNQAAASGSSPASIITRGREKKPGRPIGCCGLQNLGNTCYMNSALQCLRNCEELTKYFLSGKYKNELNPSNPLAHGGNVARSYAELLGSMFNSSCPASYAPRQFKTTIGRYGPSFSGYGQQDSQEFLAFLLDGLHEDLNRIHKKPYMEKPDSTDEMVGNEKLISELADKCWEIYKARNNSAVADLFGGLYKSTLVCPECEKVSITFDPFMDLTLPLPVENVWSKEVLYYPAGGKNLLRVPVDMDKNGTIRALKDYLGNKLKIDPKKLMGSEMYNNKFFKHYEDAKGVSAEIQTRDNPIFYELEEVPTNYPSNKQVRSLISRDDWDNDKMTEKMLVPVFNKKKGRSSDYFGLPFFIILDKAEQRDFYAILAKVCERYQSQTSTQLFASEDEGGTETPDQVVVNGEDDSINEGKRVQEQDSEEGYVDVQMEDIGDVEILKKPTKYSKEYLDRFKDLFVMKVCKKNGGDRSVQTGWADFNASIELTSRMVTQPAPPPPMRKPKRAGAAIESDESDDDYDQDYDEAFANVPEAQNSDDDATQVDDRMSNSFNKSRGGYEALSPDNFYGGKKSNNKKSKLYRENTPESAPESPPHFSSQPVEQGPLISLGEAIVCEWEEQNYENIFGGQRREGEIRGYPLWDFNEIELLQDEELLAKRRTRDNRRKRGIHLEDCLAEFAKDEILSETDPWYCPRCKEFRRARKKFELWKSPDVLVIHLKRFSSSRISRDKIDALIDFPVEGLDLNDRIGQKEEGKESVYDLFAVDNHYGGLGGGHYTAYAKNFENGQWYYFDDSSVTLVGNPTSVVTTAAYLLFYRRRTNKPLGGPIFERILGDSKPAPEEDSGNGAADNGNDSGLENSPSSSPPMRVGRIGGRDSSDNSESSSPLVSGRAGSSTTGFRSFGGAGSSSSIFDTAPSSVLSPSPVLSGSQGSGLPPSYNDAVGDRIFGPALPLGYGGDTYGPVTAPKSVNFTFGGKIDNGAPTTPTSTAGDMGDSDRDEDADGEDDVDMLAEVDIVQEGPERLPMEEADDDDVVATEHVVGGEEEGLGDGAGERDEEVGAVHEFKLSPESEEEKVGIEPGV